MMKGKICMGTILLPIGSVAMSDVRDALFAGVAGMRVCAGEEAAA